MGDPEVKSETNDTAANKNHVSVLVISPDLSLAKIIQAACGDAGPSNPEKNYRVFPGTSKEKVIEALEKYTFHSILIEEEFLVDTTPEKYLADLREWLKKKPENADMPVILVTSKTDIEKTKALVRAGWRDVLLKPLDKTLFLQKMSLYNSKIEFLKEPLLFNMDLKKPIDVAFTLTSGSVSEYGMKVESDREIGPGTVIGLSAAFLDHPIPAVVLDCKKVSDDVFAVQLMFIGVTPAETQAIRKLIRHEYAEEKQAA